MQPDLMPLVISYHIIFIEKRAPGVPVLTQYGEGDCGSIPESGIWLN
jgi:hypothetical protein